MTPFASTATGLTQNRMNGPTNCPARCSTHCSETSTWRGPKLHTMSTSTPALLPAWQAVLILQVDPEQLCPIGSGGGLTFPLAGNFLFHASAELVDFVGEVVAHFFAA